jgi:DNA-directed RNA polymerase subunit E'
MFKLVEIQEKVRFDPSHFGEPLESVILEELRKKYEGLVSKDLGGIIVQVNRIKQIEGGEIYLGDGAPYYTVTFEAIVFSIEPREVFRGIVQDAAPFGAFVNIGAFLGLLHVSQISGETLNFDQKSKCFISEKTQQRICVDDKLLVRVIGVSLGNTTKDTKVALSMRNPALGKLE